MINISRKRLWHNGIMLALESILRGSSPTRASFFSFYENLGTQGFESWPKKGILPRPASFMRPPFLYQAK